MATPLPGSENVSTPSPSIPTETNLSPPATNEEKPMSKRQRQAEARLSADPWDLDAWTILLQEAIQLQYADAEPLYKRLNTQFPPVARFWRPRADHAARDSPDLVASIFEEAVSNSPTSIELWRAYAAHAIESASPGAMNSIVVVFERAVKTAGLDLLATPLWNDYIAFLRDRAVLSDPQRRDALRRVFQRAVMSTYLLACRVGGSNALYVCTPMQHLEKVWSDYTVFEQKFNTNKEIGRVLVAEYSPKNVDARTEFRARKTRREGLSLTNLPIPPRGRSKEALQAAQWRRFIGQERSNTSTLPTEELHGRVVHAYESALVPLYRYADMWIEYLTYLYDALLPPVEVPLAAGQTAAGKRTTTPQEPEKVENAITQLEPVFARALRAMPACVALNMHISGLWERLGKPARAFQTLNSLCKNHPSPLAYVHLMRVARRVETRDSARKVFARARKDSRGAHPAVYVAAATIEFTMNKDAKVARNVFEFGMKKFGDSALMACAFAEWLWGVGEFEFMRCILEKHMGGLKGDAKTMRRLWELWIRVEHVMGGVGDVDRVEAMWQESGVGRPVGVVSNVLRRARFLGFEGMGPDEMAPTLIKGAEEPVSSGGGKRDPRTGRRMGSAESPPEIKANPTTFSHVQIAAEKLMRFASTLGASAGPPPAVDFVMQLVMKTPNAFAATPVGAANGDVLGKRGRSGPVAPVAAPPLNDVFRARQAAKQARSR